jgi:hypothetical protein
VFAASKNVPSESEFMKLHVEKQPHKSLKCGQS